MIDWSDELRRHDPGYFCKAACAEGSKRSMHTLYFFNDSFRSTCEADMDRKRCAEEN